MHEDILAGGALDESVSLRPVEPLHSTLLSHKETPFASSLRIILPPLICLPWSLCPGRRDTVAGHPLKGTVRILSLSFDQRCWAEAIALQQKRLPCSSSDGCPRRNTVKPRKTKARCRTAGTETSILITQSDHSSTGSGWRATNNSRKISVGKSEIKGNKPKMNVTPWGSFPDAL
jgi:hypothetical protein